MCCIFTCCGWMIDLIQRAWTFAMSCCMSSAICCLVFSGSMSGIALGYNYSLAEYIDMKETNVSVYLKRGVFDDEVADDMDWRRSGHLPVAGHLADNNLKTGAPEGEEGSNALRSGRRLDDSVFDSGDHNKFEGSLMKLTAKPLMATKAPSTSDLEMAEAIRANAKSGMEQIKAVQAVINRRKSNDALNDIKAKMTTHNFANMLDGLKDSTQWMNSGRRFMSDYGTTNPARAAVPDRDEISGIQWMAPKLNSGHIMRDLYQKELVTGLPQDFYVDSEKYPQPIKLNSPTRETYYHQKFVRLPTKSMDAAIKSLNEKFMAKKLHDTTKYEYALKPRDPEDDYDARGLPIRKKRDIHYIIESKRMTSEVTSSSVSDNDQSKLERNLNAPKTKQIQLTESSLLLSKLFETINGKTKVDGTVHPTHAIGPKSEVSNASKEYVVKSFPAETTTCKLFIKILQSTWMK